MIEQIRETLFALQDEDYREFQRRLLPTVRPETVIGVRTPELRRLAKQWDRQGDCSEFLNDLPHRYFDENQLHAFLISECVDCAQCIEQLNRFLPWIDNWATCDQLSPGIFQKHRSALLEQIPGWLSSGRTYIVRFGIGMLLRHFLDDAFDPIYPAWVEAIRSEEYYVNMMIAWYFATALAKQYDAVLPYLEQNRLAPWTHNMAIRKAVESRRVSSAQKAYLRSLKR